MAHNRLKTQQVSPIIPWIAIGVLLVLLVGLLATYVLRPGRNLADEAGTAVAIGNMDEAQSEADERREKKRSAAALL